MREVVPVVAGDPQHHELPAGEERGGTVTGALGDARQGQADGPHLISDRSTEGHDRASGTRDRPVPGRAPPPGRPPPLAGRVPILGACPAPTTRARTTWPPYSSTN